MDSSQLINELTKHIDIQTLCSKGRVEIPLEQIPIKADEAADLLPELLLMELPYEVRIIAKRGSYYFRITAEVFHKEHGFYIYRYFVNGKEVYVGRTNRPAKRFLEHCRDDSRYESVDRVDIHRCKTKADMIFLEKILIMSERPPWNVAEMDNGELSFEIPSVKYTQYTPFEIFQRYK